MATNRLRSTGQKGILRQMPTLGVARLVAATSSTGLSAYTQAGAFPDVPQADSTVTQLFLKATGTIPEDEDPITVQTLHGGMVGLGEASFIWSQAIDDDLRPVINTGSGKGSIDTVRGWEWPSYATYYQALVFDDAPDLEQLDSATLSDGRVLQAYRLYDSGSSVSVIVKVRALDGTWTDVTVYESTDTTRTLFLPCLVVLPDDRVIVYLMNYPPGGETFQIQARVIFPEDLTVGDYEVACLKSALAIDTYGSPDSTSQLRGAMKPDGTCVLVLATDISGTTQILQLGSYDYGHSFDVVSYGSVDEDHRYPDVVWCDGCFVVSYARAIEGEEINIDVVAVKRLAHYFDSLASAPTLATYKETADGGTDSVILGNALVATPDGLLYGVNTVRNDDSQEVYGHVHVSQDLGDTWTDSADADKPNVGYDSGSIGPSWLYFTISTSQETAAVPFGICATYQGNRVYVGTIFGKDSQTSDNFDDGSLLAFYLGGWSNQQKTFIDNLAKTSDGQLSYKEVFFGFVDPEFNGWTKTTSGTAAGLPIAGKRNINTSDGGKLVYSRGGGTSVSTCSGEFDVSSAVFNTMAQGDVGLEIQIDNGTLKYQLGLYLVGSSSTATGLLLRDRVAGTTIATIPIDFTDEYTYKFELYNSKFQLFYRPADSTDDQVWERAKDPFSGDTYAGYTLTSTASTGATASVSWGHFFATTTGSTGDAISNWRRVLVSFGTNLATSAVSSGIKNWFIASYVDYASTDDFHNGYHYVDSPVWVTDGVYVKASGGPTYFMDQWEIGAAYQYGVRNIMPEVAASPLRHWRSTSDDVDVTITWVVGAEDIDTAIADVVDEWPGGESFFVYLQGTNFKTAAFYGVDESDNEEKICDCVFTRWGTLIVDTHGGTTMVQSGGGTQYVGLGELAGSYIILSGDGLPRKITTNSEGQLNTTTKRVTVRFEADGNEDQGIDNDAGNCIFGTVGLFANHDMPSNHFKAYKLKIPAQTTAEGYFKIGKCIFGPPIVFGLAPSEGFSTELPQDNTLLNETQAGHTEARVYNDTPRIKSLSWNSADQTMLDQASPDYVQFAVGDEPQALYDDVARQLYGLYRELHGADGLVVYCDQIPAVTNTGQLDPERLMYGRCRSSFQESNIVGDEGTDELVQVTNWTMKEEL
jgi:hypothetical protein